RAHHRGKVKWRTFRTSTMPARCARPCRAIARSSGEGVAAMNDLQGKVAIVTGGTGGIGKGVALQLAARGATVVINGRNEDKARPVLDEIRRQGGEGCFVAGDVRSQDDMEAVAAKAARRLGGIDIVVPNAGGNDDEARQPQVRGPFADI